MSKYLLDFAETPLKPEAGGQLHIIVVGEDPDSAHDCVEAAITHFVKSFGLVGETDTFVPLARVRVTNIGGQGSYVEKVQVEPASAAPDYDPDPVKPTSAEVLAAFPKATDITITGHEPPRRSFFLHRTRFIVLSLETGACHVESMGKGEDNELEFALYFSALKWPVAVRMLAQTVLDNDRATIANLTTDVAGLEAAIGGTP